MLYNIFITSIKEGYNNHNKIFIQHDKKYINSYDELHHLIKINCDKNINKLIKSITSDILNGTYESDIKYHDWIKNNEILIKSIKGIKLYGFFSNSLSNSTHLNSL